MNSAKVAPNTLSMKQKTLMDSKVAIFPSLDGNIFEEEYKKEEDYYESNGRSGTVNTNVDNKKRAK